MHPFTYTKVSTPADAVRAVAAGGPGTRFLAGGTTLYDLMKLNVETPTHVVDVTGLDGSERNQHCGRPRTRLRRPGADERRGGGSERLVSDYPALSESLWKAASQQLRNMATVGGNLLQRTRCAYFRIGEPFACNKRKPGSGCAAQDGIDRGHALLGGSKSCIAVYPGDWAIALAAFDAKVDVLGAQGERTIPLERAASRAGRYAQYRDHAGSRRS